MQYHISKRLYVVILLAALFVHLCILLLLFSQPIISWADKHVAISFEEDDYTVTHILSAGSQSSTELFQDDASTQADYEQSTDTHAQPAYSTPATPIEQSQAQAPASQSKTVDNANSCTEPTNAVRPKTKTSKRQLTLADISRGFMRSVQQEAGHNHSACNAKELALQLYASKVWSSIKNAFLVGENRLRLPQAVRAHAQLYVTINRAGKLVDARLVYPAQYAELKSIENLLIARAQEAGLFPPFGAQMSGETQRFCFPLYVQGEEGFHSYSLRYGANR